MNGVLAGIVSDWNSRPMKRNGESRQERFQRLDRPELWALPREPLQFLELPVERRVPADHHIAFDKVSYSVPYRLIGEVVHVRASTTVVEVRHDGLTVAIHPRSYCDNRVVTVDTHRPKNHRDYVDLSFNDWVSTLHPAVSAIVESELAQTERDIDRNALMLRVRKLMRVYRAERLTKACLRAQENGAPFVQHVSNLLVKGLEGHPSLARSDEIRPVDSKENVRGSEYFDRDLDDGKEAA